MRSQQNVLFGKGASEREPVLKLAPHTWTGESLSMTKKIQGSNVDFEFDKFHNQFMVPTGTVN